MRAAPARWASLALLAAALTAAGAGRAQSPTESGTIRVSMLERPIGTEQYQIAAETGGTRVTSTLDLVERGSPLQLTSTLRLGADLTPIQFTAKGRSYRFVNVDATVDVANGVAQVRHLGETADVRLPDTYFTALSYAPLVGRALLVRYWERHGKPRQLALVPGTPTRRVSIEFRGVDSVRVGGQAVRLRRFIVDGVVWGREWLWLDDQDRFAAIVTRIHILPLEAVRADLEDALPALQQRAVDDMTSIMREQAASTPRVAEGSFVLDGAALIDGTGRPSVADSVIVVRDGKIVAAGARAAVSTPPGVRVIDARGTTAIPGLWDMHAHASQIEWAPAYLGVGVTTIRDMGAESRYITAFRDAAASAAVVGPRVLVAGLVDGDAPAAFGAVTASTPAEARSIVERYHAAGFQQMKLYSLLQPDVVEATTKRAHELGMTVTGHVPTSLGTRRAIEAGMDQVAHMPIEGEPGSAELRETIALLAKRQVVVDPTIPWTELLGRAPETPIESFESSIGAAPLPMVFSYRSVVNKVDPASARERLERQLAMIKTLYDAGVPIVAGTDGGVPGYSLLRSLELYVQAGLTPMAAIQSATSVAAKAMGEAATAGTIEPGKRADLLVLDADPLADIRNIRRSRWVVVGGRMYETAKVRPLGR